MGGLRRRREMTVQAAYDVGELDSVQDIRRILKIAVLDVLGLENSISRARALAQLATVATGLLKEGELEERVKGLEEVVKQRTPGPGARR